MLKKAFTLVEITVTAIIGGLLLMMALPNFNQMINRARAQDIYQNLKAIYYAQQRYIQDNNNYCNAAGTCGTDFRTINANLNLNIVPNGASYNCSGTICTSSPVNNPFTMMVDLTLPIVSTRAVYCTAAVPNVPDAIYNPCCNSTGGKTPGETCPY